MTETVFAQTPLLKIGFETGGPEAGTPALLLHGWPDDARTWDATVEALHAAGFRSYRPYLRGFGPTRFRSPDTQRSGELAALAQDALDFANAIGLERFALIGHDWGARAAYIATRLRPERVSALAALSVGWGTNDPGQALSFKQTRNYWYHWFMALERGARQVEADRRGYARFLWESWSPSWRFSDAEFEATASAFDNPDWVEITLHSYRHRWGLAPGDPAYAPIAAQIAADPVIQRPTLTLHGAEDGANDPETSENRARLFAAAYERIVIDGAGHFPQRETPEVVNTEIIRFLRAHD